MIVFLLSFSKEYYGSVLACIIVEHAGQKGHNRRYFKHIKYCLRNWMGQERLKGLVMLSNEASDARAMDADKVIDRFADTCMKVRR